LAIENLRGQGYDNAPNMTGIFRGVKSRILEINPRAFHVPCCSHTLNLVIVDSMKSSVPIATFFSYVQLVYTFLSASTKRWDIFMAKFPKFTVKKLCDTRWESHINAIRALRMDLPKVFQALQDIAKTENKPLVKVEAESIANKITTFEFLCGLIIWYDVLFEINVVSKQLQTSGLDVSAASKSLNELISFLKINYNAEKFENVIKQAQIIAHDLEVNDNFLPEDSVRVRKRKRFFDESDLEEEKQLSPKVKFENDFFNVIFETSIEALNERFSALNELLTPFNFLFEIKKLLTLSDEELKSNCLALENILTDGPAKDLDGECLWFELKSFVNRSQDSPESALKFIYGYGLEEIYPNLAIALRILLTLPVSVASGERSFSKLKLIKNYLRSTMSQDRLNGLAMISIEHEVADNLDTENLRLKFAQMKARKAAFST
jgi:hypothetical protein